LIFILAGTITITSIFGHSYGDSSNIPPNRQIEGCGVALNNFLFVFYNHTVSCSYADPTILSQAKWLSAEDLNLLLDYDKKIYGEIVTGPQCDSCHNPDVTKMCTYDSHGNFVSGWSHKQPSDAQKRVLLDMNKSYSVPICPFTGKPTPTFPPPDTIITSAGSINVMDLGKNTTNQTTSAKTSASKCDNCTHDEMLSKWVSSLPDGAIVPVVILFQGQPSIDDIKSHKKIDYTGDIELIKSYGGNVKNTYDIIHGAAANIQKDKVLPLANDPRIVSVDLDYPSCVIPEGCPSNNSTKNNNASENLSVYDVLAIHSKESLSPPLKQIKSGISAQDVKCKAGHALVIKLSNGYPACVRLASEQRFLVHGWITPNLTTYRSIIAMTSHLVVLVTR